MKIFWDTNLFIYLWENGPQSSLAHEFANWIVDQDHHLVTSSLTVGEILVQPMRTGDADRIEKYIHAFNRIEIIAFGTTTAQAFASLRAQHKPLRPPDAIQLACAMQARADAFLTNDDRLTRISTGTPMRQYALESWANLKNA